MNKPITNLNNDDQQYFHDFFTSQLSILDCKVKVPRKTLWRGHPFYYELLQSFGKQVDFCPKIVENILSLPLWYNKFLGTKFNVKLSKLGYNYLRDFYKEGALMKQVDLSHLQPYILRALINLISKIPNNIKESITNASPRPIVIKPSQIIQFGGVDYCIDRMDSKMIYKKLITPKIKLPTGLLNWCLEFELSDEMIHTALTFAHTCCTSTFDRVFQYKINTQILPTNEYLNRYKVKDTNICDHCGVERDSIVHRLYDCEKLAVITNIIFNFLKSMGLNHFLLEFKKTIFYPTTADLNSPTFFNRIKTIIIKEKQLSLKNGKFSQCCVKW